MKTTLPSSIAQYFAAANAHDSAGIAAAFTHDAVVFDEGREHRGTAAIQKWSNEANEKYQPKADVTNVADAEGKTTVTAQVSGTFPGSPLQIRYSFTLSGDKIAALKIEA
jgi:ketosteroid isomerase-like protein